MWLGAHPGIPRSPFWGKGAGARFARAGGGTERWPGARGRRPWEASCDLEVRLRSMRKEARSNLYTVAVTVPAEDLPDYLFSVASLLQNWSSFGDAETFTWIQWVSDKNSSSEFTFLLWISFWIALLYKGVVKPLNWVCPVITLEIYVPSQFITFFTP